MQTIVRRQCSILIERPIDEVRAQFSDMRYHESHNVHPEITFKVQDAPEGGACRYTSKISLAGMPQVDEVVDTILDNGDIRTSYISGMNAGGTLMQTFAPEAGGTRVALSLEVPLRGAKALIAPIFGAAAQSAMERALAQDKRDLEAGNYARYRTEKVTSPA